MRWKGRQGSKNVDDRRGMKGGGLVIGEGTPEEIAVSIAAEIIRHRNKS